MDIEDLIELGLTMNESKVYLTLLRHKKLIAFKLARMSGVPSSKIYEIINGLTEKGLVKKSTNLLNITEDIEKKLIQLKEELKNYSVKLRISNRRSLRVFYEPLPLSNLVAKRKKELCEKMKKLDKLNV
jgi:sugar-specific transcriptional regulator TrmB